MIFGAPALICTGFGVGMFLTVSCGWNGAAGIIAGPCALNLVAPISNANSNFISVTLFYKSKCLKVLLQVFAEFFLNFFIHYLIRY
jgi:hypothetical protein